MSELDINPEVNHINGDSDSDGSSIQEPLAKSPKIDEDSDDKTLSRRLSTLAALRNKRKHSKIGRQNFASGIRSNSRNSSQKQDEFNSAIFNSEPRAKSPKIEQGSADSFEIVTPTRPLSSLSIARDRTKQKKFVREQHGERLGKRMLSNSSVRSSQIDSASQSADISFSPSSIVFSSPTELPSTPKTTNAGSQQPIISPIEEARRILLKRVLKLHRDNESWNKRKRNTFEFEFDPRKTTTMRQLIEFVTVLRNFVVQEIIEVRGQIRNQLTVQLEGPKKSENEMKRRQICRMGIHIYNDALDKIDKDSYQPITVVYQEAWCLFMERFDITNIDLMEDKKEKEPDHKVRIEEERCVEIEPTPQIDEMEDGESETDPEYDFEDDGALDAREKRMKKAQKAAKNSPPRLNNTYAVVGEIAELLKNVWGDDVLEEFDEDVDVVGKSLLGQRENRQNHISCDETTPHYWKNLNGYWELDGAVVDVDFKSPPIETPTFKNMKFVFNTVDIFASGHVSTFPVAFAISAKADIRALEYKQRENAKKGSSYLSKIVASFPAVFNKVADAYVEFFNKVTSTYINWLPFGISTSGAVAVIIIAFVIWYQCRKAKVIAGINIIEVEDNVSTSDSEREAERRGKRFFLTYVPGAQ
ncbi:hypothetical protein L3Y34_013910 [Caenorhabditis briggsae]|uniref:Uncharacterized protein n=1 Tax=Caenorhabditis briggsae TaxID=6238 RepID=A0AAE9IXD0_CAEBR|nr:hypothetical protein L3Y34_013910 [Caenorhabditis briggsae]